MTIEELQKQVLDLQEQNKILTGENKALKESNETLGKTNKDLQDYNNDLYMRLAQGNIPAKEDENKDDNIEVETAEELEELEVTSLRELMKERR